MILRFKHNNFPKHINALRRKNEESMIDFTSFGWPQWLILAWIAFTVLSIGSKNGEAVTIRAAPAIAIQMLVLTTLTIGGFFN